MNTRSASPAGSPRHRRWRAGAVLTLTAGVLLPGAAASDECQPRNGLSTCIAADTAWLYPGDSRWFRLAPTDTIPHGTVSFGLVASYLSRPIGLRIASPDPEGTTVWAVDDVVGATYLLALGLGGRTQIGLTMPTVLYQDGSGTADIVGSETFLPRSAAGDLRFGMTTTVVDRDPSADGPTVAGRFELSLPTGGRTTFTTNGAPVYAPGVGYDHRLGRVRWGLDASGRIRPTRELAGARIGSQLGAAAGVAVDILDDAWLSAGLEASALVTLVEQQELRWDAQRLERVAEPTDGLHVPAEWMLSVRSAGLLDGRLVTSLGGGSFIPSGDSSPVTAPRFRFLLGVRYVPRDDVKGTAAETPRDDE